MKAMIACSALLSVLATATGGPVHAAAPAADATTERFHCYRIKAGDSAADVARHLTGHRGNLSGSLFQIFDSHRRLVSTDQYSRIAPGWTVCLREGRSPIAIRTSAPINSTENVQPLPAVAELQRAFYYGDIWWFASLVLTATTSMVALNSWRRQRVLANNMRAFAGDFVQEFGRPWAHYRGGGTRPRVGVRINPRQNRLEILVAPAPGSTYPNLSDHRTNVEYDVLRVSAALQHTAFSPVHPYAEGEWVVLPFQFKGRVNQEGVR